VTSIVLQLVNYKEIFAVIIVAGIAYFWKGHSARGNDLSQRQNWTVAHVAILFTLVDLAVGCFYFLPYVLGGSSFLPYALTSFFGFVVGLNIIGLASFFCYVGQPLSTVGYSRESWASLGLLGLRMALIMTFINCVAMGVYSFLTPSLYDEMKAFDTQAYFEPTGSLRPLGFLLLEQVFQVATVVFEEIKYRGLLYGALRKRMAPLPAQLLSAAAFTVAHNLAHPLNFAMGWLTAYLREKYQSVIPGIVLHVAWNVSLDIGGLSIRSIGVAPPMFYVSAAALTGVVYVAVYWNSGLWKWERPRSESESRVC
jgi:membrane protease YdiL (CAAX protease family)